MSVKGLSKNTNKMVGGMAGTLIGSTMGPGGAVGDFTGGVGYAVGSPLNRSLDVIIGKNYYCEEESIVHKEDSRRLNTLVLGPTGTGISAFVFLPMIYQDLQFISQFLNTPQEVQQKSKKILNGLTVIDPNKDMNKRVSTFIQDHHIPNDYVKHIDPTKPDTFSINPLNGTVEQACEVITSFYEKVSVSSEPFFREQEKTYLLFHTRLLKMHNPTKQPTMRHLVDMFSNQQLVYQMHNDLKELIKQNLQVSTVNSDYIVNLQVVDEWFNKVSFSKYNEHTSGLRNIFSTLSTNPLVERVLFGNKEIDWEKHVQEGGILLVNTSKAELGDFSDALGAIALKCLQNAIFNRKVESSMPYHSLYCYDFGQFAYSTFPELTAQSRKYNCLITASIQSLQQLSSQHGFNYMLTTLQTFRNIMCMGGANLNDLQIIEPLFGCFETDEKQKLSIQFLPMGVCMARLNNIESVDVKYITLDVV